jgi:hypothetical protein
MANVSTSTACGASVEALLAAEIEVLGGKLRH